VLENEKTIAFIKRRAYDGGAWFSPLPRIDFG
jgi:hypothetical protein